MSRRGAGQLLLVTTRLCRQSLHHSLHPSTTPDRPAACLAQVQALPPPPVALVDAQLLALLLLLGRVTHGLQIEGKKGGGWRREGGREVGPRKGAAKPPPSSARPCYHAQPNPNLQPSKASTGQEAPTTLTANSSCRPARCTSSGSDRSPPSSASARWRGTRWGASCRSSRAAATHCTRQLRSTVSSTCGGQGRRRSSSNHCRVSMNGMQQALASPPASRRARARARPSGDSLS